MKTKEKYSRVYSRNIVVYMADPAVLTLLTLAKWPPIISQSTHISGHYDKMYTLTTSLDNFYRSSFYFLIFLIVM